MAQPSNTIYFKCFLKFYKRQNKEPYYINVESVYLNEYLVLLAIVISDLNIDINASFVKTLILCCVTYK